MRTNILLNDNLVKEAFKYSPVSTKRRLIEQALTEFISNHKRKNLNDLKGKIKFADDYDYKKARIGK